MAFSGRASEGGRRALGPLSRAPVWEQVEARIRSEGRYPPSFYLYLVVAGMIGSVGIVTNSQILIVAAMVVGPEYGAIVSVALGIDRGHRAMVRSGLAALGTGFLLTVVVTFLFALLIRGFGLQSEAFDRGCAPSPTSSTRRTSSPSPSPPWPGSSGSCRSPRPGRAPCSACSSR